MTDIECLRGSMAPREKESRTGARLAQRLESLRAKKSARLMGLDFPRRRCSKCVGERNWRNDIPGVQFVSWKEFAKYMEGMKKEMLAALPEKLKKYNCDAVICGVGC